jgi:hypothetical protein
MDLCIMKIRRTIITRTRRGNNYSCKQGMWWISASASVEASGLKCGACSGIVICETAW